MSDIAVELELSVSALAGIYRWMGWPLALCEESTPTAVDLAELITHVACEAVGEETGAYYTLGRIVAFSATEVPGEVELALKIGRAYLPLGEEADAPPANRFTARPAEHRHDDLGPEATA
ncbi:MAG: hypothetical protein HOY79_28825 [Streptomyces sp.]|nr:hypothetical protein [Streptomyces sp.]